MRRIILSGCNGKMGRVITDAVVERHDCVITAGFDINTESSGSFPVLSDPFKFEGVADVIIDFSNPAFLPKLLEFVSARRIPAVVATTGLSPSQVEMLREVSKKVPIFFTANMSLGVNLVRELAKKAAAVLGDSFDIEIIEKHHNQKVDAPSGTALMLADSISTVLPHEPQYVYDRHSVRRKREKNEIGIHAIRGGTIVGEHEILFAGRDEVISIKHSAMSKPGFYDMGDLVSSIGG